MLQKTICGGIYAESIVFLLRVQCRRKESSRSLSHLLMSFLSVDGLDVPLSETLVTVDHSASNTFAVEWMMVTCTGKNFTCQSTLNTIFLYIF